MVSGRGMAVGVWAETEQAATGRRTAKGGGELVTPVRGYYGAGGGRLEKMKEHRPAYGA